MADDNPAIMSAVADAYFGQFFNGICIDDNFVYELNADESIKDPTRQRFARNVFEIFFGEPESCLPSLAVGRLSEIGLSWSRVIKLVFVGIL